MVGIAGGTASGKTCLANAVADMLAGRCVILAQDRFYRSAPPSGPLPNFDHPDAIDRVEMRAAVAALGRGESVMVPRYDFTTHQQYARASWDQLPAAPIVIVEGILVLAMEELRPLLELSIYVHAPADVRLMRRLRRDVSERGRSMQSVLAQYEATVRPMHDSAVEPSRAHAHLEVDGTEPVAQLRDLVVSRLPARPSGP